MNKNIFGLKYVSNEAIVEVIRRKFLSESDTNPQLYHWIDVQRVRNEDWQVERFVIEYGTEDDSYRALVRALQWKKSFGIHDRPDNYYPKELYRVFDYEFGADREGRTAVWTVGHRYKKLVEFTGLLNEFCAHINEKVDRMAGNKGWVTVRDYSRAGIANYDLNLARFDNELLHYYPKGVRLALTVDLPWILNPLWKVMKTFVAKNFKNNVLLVKRVQLADYFAADAIPVPFGGVREQCFDKCFDQMLSLNELKGFDFTQQQINAFYKAYGFGDQS